MYSIFMNPLDEFDDWSTSLLSNAPFFLGQTWRNSLPPDTREKPKPWTDPGDL